MVDSSNYDDPDYEPDPLFVNSLREAKWILLMWCCCLVWTLTVCLNMGYPKVVNPETFPMILGIPAWVACGIALPWCLANVVTFVFCLRYMTDGDLGDDPDLAAGNVIAGGDHA